PKRYRNTGKERDEESGLYYHGARYYASWLGRWISTDPTGPAYGLNLFRYSTNSPIRFVDQTGRKPEDVSGPNFYYPWELKPEDFCQGPCLTDREIYRDIDSIMQKENQRREQEEFAGSFEKRF